MFNGVTFSKISVAIIESIDNDMIICGVTISTSLSCISASGRNITNKPVANPPNSGSYIDICISWRYGCAITSLQTIICNNSYIYIYTIACNFFFFLTFYFC